MAKVFLSYDREDLPRAKAVAALLEDSQHEVWWDRDIQGGAQYSREIERALDDSDNVVVLWSKASIESEWVRDEAAEGRDNGKLIPVLIDQVKPPMGFRQFQTIDLKGWSGRGQTPSTETLLRALKPSDKDPIELSKPSAASTAPRWRRPQLLLAGLIALVLALGAGLWLARGRSGSQPVIQVAPADASARSIAAANNLFVKLGGLAQLGQGKWQLINATDTGRRADLIFRTSDTGSDVKPQSSLVLVDGKTGTLIWSREFAFPAGQQADLQQQMALTTGRVLDCAIENRESGGLPPDLFKLFLNSCGSLADLSGDDYAPVIAQLRAIVDRKPDFEPAWSRLIGAETTAYSYARYSDSEAPLERQLQEDVARARKRFPQLPEVAIADVSLQKPHQPGRSVEFLEAALAKSPNNSQLLAQMSSELMNVGRMSEAVSKAKRAAELDPLSPGGTTVYIMTLAHAGDVATAQRELAKAKELWTGTGSLRDVEIAFHSRYGDPALAMKLDPSGFGNEAFAAARADPSPANIAKFKARVDAFRSKDVNPLQVGWAIQGLSQFGLVDDVYYWLGRISADELANFSYVLFRPSMAAARNDRRFIPLAAKIGLVKYWRDSGKWPDFCDRPGISYDCKAEAAKLTR